MPFCCPLFLKTVKSRKIISANDIQHDVKFREIAEGCSDYDYAPGDATGAFDADFDNIEWTITPEEDE